MSILTKLLDDREQWARKRGAALSRRQMAMRALEYVIIVQVAVLLCRYHSEIVSALFRALS